MDSSSTPATGADPPEPARGDDSAAIRAWDCLRPALVTAGEVAGAAQHEGPAWMLRGLVVLIDLAIILGGLRR